MGCTEQYQFCGTEYCTDLGGLQQVNDTSVIASLHLNDNQFATLTTMIAIMWDARIGFLFFSFADEVLLARDRLCGVQFHLSGNIYSDERMNSNPLHGLYYSTTLNDEQWRVEAENLHNMALAKMQKQFSLRPRPIDTGFTSANGSWFINTPSNEAERKLCYQQKVKSNAYRSFSVFGIALLLSFGILIMLIRVSLPTIASAMERRSHSPREIQRLDAWNQMDVLNLLCHLLEHLNDVSFQDMGRSVPFTKERDVKMQWTPRKEPHSESVDTSRVTTITPQSENIASKPSFVRREFHTHMRYRFALKIDSGWLTSNILGSTFSLAMEQ